MQRFIRHLGIAAPLRIDNIDTDQIIPSREMNRVSKSGLGDGLFAGWRYRFDGIEKTGPNEDFVLNDPAYRNASILLGGRNFGCGSSREHAVWALRDFGIRVIIAESFGRIFHNNCARNGVLAIELAADPIDTLQRQVAEAPQRNRIAIDLERRTVTSPAGEVFDFDVAESDRDMLVNGLDHIEFTLQYQADIDAYVKRSRAERTWAHL
ncbi:MAG: 3-isopropylmalate dehydratase small subunit [Woeseiaceae bacterium]|nr:3-isopropylmalate dehydratase small subunit [Woeseiaceae bacterium]